MSIRPAHHYQHEQTIAATVWTVPHNLNIQPVVEVYVYIDGVLQKLLPAEVKIVDLNTVQVTFTEAQIGVVRCM